MLPQVDSFVVAWTPLGGGFDPKFGMILGIGGYSPKGNIRFLLAFSRVLLAFGTCPDFGNILS